MTGEEMKVRREAAGLSMEHMARKIGVSLQGYTNWEKGTVPRRLMKAKIEKAFESLKEV